MICANDMSLMYNYSIIIPHYNIPDILIRCLRSIPVRDDVQVIVVDDGSPDAAEFIERYPELSAPNVEFVQMEHQGLAGVMRNVGLEHAQGKWVTFVDADDFLSDEADQLMTENVNSPEDIIFFNVDSVMSDDISVKSSRNYGYQSLISEYERTCDESIRYKWHSVWGKIYKRELIENNKIRCDATPYGNDVIFSIESGFFAKNIKIENRIFYTVTERLGSIAYSLINQSDSNPSLLECETRLNVAIRKLAFLKQHNVSVNICNAAKNDINYYLSLIKVRYRLSYIKLLITHPSYIRFITRQGLTYVKQKLYLFFNATRLWQKHK